MLSKWNAIYQYKYATPEQKILEGFTSQKQISSSIHTAPPDHHSLSSNLFPENNKYIYIYIYVDCIANMDEILFHND